jgi:hypothetical protein
LQSVNKSPLKYGGETRIFLFGSRTDDSKKGGDIDLYIQLNEESEPQKNHASKS